jgi:hypothetical protein
MPSVRFPAMGFERSYGEFYRGCMTFGSSYRHVAHRNHHVGRRPGMNAAIVAGLWLLFLQLATVPCYATEQADLQKENLQAIQRVLRKGDAALDWFHALAKRPVDTTHAVMVVEAAPTELRPGAHKRSPESSRMIIGVFVVSGTDNRVQLVLDTYPRNVGTMPVLDQTTDRSACLHLYSEYGFYHGSIKYFFDLPGRTPTLKIRYGILALTSSTRGNGKLHYTASFGGGGQVLEGWEARDVVITIEPRTGDALPAFTIVDAPEHEANNEEPAPLRASDGTRVVIAKQDSSGPAHRPSGISIVGKSGSTRFFPVPLPTVDLYRKAAPERQPPIKIENEIGAFALDGTRVWFANSFYDGEGHSGVGAVGTFDIQSGRYHMRYLPEIAASSGSAILLDGDALWIGLLHRGEGAAMGRGLLLYNTKIGSVKRYALPDVIYTIDQLGDALYCGTSHGLYMVRDDKVTQLRFEPDDKGTLIMVASETRLAKDSLRHAPPND